MEQLNQQIYQSKEPEKRNKKVWVGRIGILIIILLGLFYVAGKLGDSKSEEVKEVLSNRVYHMNDDSALYLHDDGTYQWYLKDAVQDDNYYSGTFKVYHADAAEEYLVTDLIEYGINEEEIQEIYQRNSEDNIFEKENLYCFVMNCNLRIVDGERNEDVSTIPYFGFSDGKIYDFANMNTGTYLKIKNVELIKD